MPKKQVIAGAGKVQFAVFGARSIAPRSSHTYTTTREPLASHGKLRHNAMIVNWFGENFLLASLIWGSIAGGYLIYGWRQKAALPLAGGAVMMVVSCFLPALPMSLICIVTMAAVYWLAKRDY